MGNLARVVVLAEDERHQRFIRRYLNRLNYREHDIYFEALPSGRGCGEQWVRERYAKAVRAHRTRASRSETALVVVIDADNGDRRRRLHQFQQILAGSGLNQRGNQERIAHIVPRRSIETWVLCLSDIHVDEETDYSRNPEIDQRIPAAAEVFFTWSRPNAAIPEHCVPSLRATIPEVGRIE